jgi:hypothetical protein
MDIPTIPGALYTVATKTTCDITDTATGTPIDSVSSGSVTFTAQGSVTTLSDPAAIYSNANFNYAGAGLRKTGAGVLPPAFLPAAFLESSGEQFLRFPYATTAATSAEGRVQVIETRGTQSVIYVMGCANYPLAMGWGVWEYNNAVEWGWMFYGAESGGITINSSLPSKTSLIEYRITTSGVLLLNGQQAIPRNTQRKDSASVFSIGLFGIVGSDNQPRINYKQRHFALTLFESQKKTVALVAAVDKTGVACMVDTVSGQTYYNTGSGSFIVGLTLEQARKLGTHLPKGGGTLKIKLPENYTDDEAVNESISTANANGWIFETDTYTAAEASASAFALRRIWVKKTADPAGAYVDGSGARWRVEKCQTVLGAEPTDLGYEPFRSVEVALAEWELTPYIPPEEEP